MAGMPASALAVAQNALTSLEGLDLGGFSAEQLRVFGRTQLEQIPK
jgi:hypothetical protein